MKGYLSIPEWEKLQHYKDRTPPWIKLHNELLESYEFECLPDASKAHLLCIWLLASRTGNKINPDPRWIGRKIGANSEVDIDVLVASGFLQLNQPLQTMEQDASKMLQTAEQDACLEREGEGEGEGKGEVKESRKDLVPDSPKPEKHSEDDLQCAEWIFGLIRQMNPGHKEPNFGKWADTIRLMRERDKRSHREICELFKWANNDNFWQANILSPAKLRQQWDKLTLARNRDGKVNPGSSGRGVEAAMARSAAAFKAKLEGGSVDLEADDPNLWGGMDQGTGGSSGGIVVDGDFETIPDGD